jgi:hypothetical protein
VDESGRAVVFHPLAQRLRAPPNFDDVQDLERKILSFIDEWNEQAAPFNSGRRSPSRRLWPRSTPPCKRFDSHAVHQLAGRSTKLPCKEAVVRRAIRASEPLSCRTRLLYEEAVFVVLSSACASRMIAPGADGWSAVLCLHGGDHGFAQSYATRPLAPRG